MPSLTQPLPLRGAITGLDLAVRILGDLEVEVVMFSEGRTKDEIAHNTLIKDYMRRPGPAAGQGQGLHGEEVTLTLTLTITLRPYIS